MFAALRSFKADQLANRTAAYALIDFDAYPTFLSTPSRVIGTVSLIDVASALTGGAVRRTYPAIEDNTDNFTVTTRIELEVPAGALAELVSRGVIDGGGCAGVDAPLSL